MAGIEDRVVGNDRELAGETLVQRGRIAAGQVGAPTSVEEQRVAGNEAAVDEETLRTRRVARRMDQRDRHGSDVHGVARGVEHKIGVGRARHAFDAVRLFGLYVHLRGDSVDREELGESFDGPAAEISAHMIRVVVGHEHVGESQAVGADDVDEFPHAVRGVDRDGLARLAVAHEVHEVHHLLGDRIRRGEVAPGEQLTEVQAVVVHGPQRKVLFVPDGNLFDLTAKTAIVTGGGRGLGKAIALGLAAAGADIVVASRKVENCELVAREIEGRGGRAQAVACHVGRTDQIDALVDTAYSTFGHVDIVVNNAAMSPGTQLVDSSPELFHKTYATNTLGPMWLASRCAPRMREHGGGVIVNVVTTGAFRPGAGLGLYCSSKAALHALTLVMAKEWASWGVRVNEIAPGPFLTDMMAPGAANPEFTARMYDQMLIKRIADPTEIVGAVLYLASDASGFATGTTVTVDGGISA